MNQPPPRNGGITRVQPGIVSMPGDVPKVHTGPRRITIVPAPIPKVPVQASSVPERPKSRVTTKVPPMISSQSNSKVSSRPPVTENSRKEFGVTKPASTRSQSQTRTTKPSQAEKTKEVSQAPPRSRARTTSSARPPSRMDLSKSTRPSSRTDLTKSTRTGATATTKVPDQRKRPEHQLVHSEDFKGTVPAVSVPLPPSPTLPPTSTTDSLPSLKLETEVEFVPPVTMSPRKTTAETKVVHALKMGLPLLGSPRHSPPPTTKVEDVPLRVATPEPAEPEESTQEPAQVQEPTIQVVEEHGPAPVLVAEQPTEPLPVLVHLVAGPSTPLRMKGNERTNKVGDLVAHFEDANRRKPDRPSRMVEQTPISALVSTIRKGFEDMKPLPALEIVEEGDSISITPPPRPIGGLKVGGVKGLNIRSKSGLGERTVLTTMQLNS
ncbi:hypothetical protein BDM02DRAFT_3177240 [Thelephora ganbajun]|uniref:Uncharacterized protein n=1 Tax=Thelephora ganbajun TaxID=370292 RepID=A0ACB6ZW09_THEGA|nr:hypothetical protein BDM02DRAFT_3177240 [Thelephora ganbajun]